MISLPAGIGLHVRKMEAEEAEEEAESRFVVMRGKKCRRKRVGFRMVEVVASVWEAVDGGESAVIPHVGIKIVSRGMQQVPSGIQEAIDGRIYGNGCVPC